MSLDRQRILSELGSVMNQLKSADCGCMGKLFSNQNQGQGAARLPTCGGCRRGHCYGHGYSHSTPCAGEPYATGHSGNHHCMGHCNPPKLYADTYSYLNNNLMQPVVREVYNDLKSINPGNTVMNNPIANQMGLTGNSSGMAPGGANNGNITSPMQNVSGMDTGNTNMSMGQPQPMNPMGDVGGMGPQIVNMIMGDSGNMKPSDVQNAPGLSPRQGMSMPADMNSARYNNNPGFTNANIENMNQPGNMSGFADPQTQYVSKENMYTLGTSHVNNPSVPVKTPQMSNSIAPGYMAHTSQGNSSVPVANPQVGNMSNSLAPGGGPTVQQVSANNQPQYGQNAQSMMHNIIENQHVPSNNTTQCGKHTQGITKFNEMFPGVMQGGDLGFDPMAIAIQMNPANQQKAAMDTMQRIMTNGPAGKLKDTAGNPAVMRPAIEATKTAGETITSVPGMQGQQYDSYNQINNQQYSGQQQVQNVPPGQTLNQQINSTGQQKTITLNAEGGVQSQANSIPQQQVYTTVTGQPMLNQQQTQPQLTQFFQQPPESAQYQQNSYLDPNSQNGMFNLNAQPQPTNLLEARQNDMPPPQNLNKEPIFPADTSRNRPITYSKPQQKYHQYNTLGQPVEMLPAKNFHPPEPSLPQTLSPQPFPTKARNDYMKYSNVKSTVSKTSLAGNKPVGQTPSRSQLQHIYNQYRGSQSYTQQNVKPTAHGNTFSEGRLNIPQSNTMHQVPVEKVGGDTAANNQLNRDNRISNNIGQVMEQIGDVPAAYKPQYDEPPLKGPGSPIPARQAKLRNGLQDVEYTSYPSSAAWSFHGTNTYRPASIGYRFRNYK